TALLRARVDGAHDVAAVEAAADVVQERRQRTATLGLLEAPDALDDESRLQNDEHDQRGDQRSTLLDVVADLADHREEVPDGDRNRRREGESNRNDETTHILRLLRFSSRSLRMPRAPAPRSRGDRTP